jgi:hypothetical protein
MIQFIELEVLFCSMLHTIHVQHFSSEWFLFYAKRSYLSSYIMIRTLHFDEMMMMMLSALTRPNTLRWIFIVLVDWNNSLRVDILLHSNKYRANQSMLLLLNAGFLEEKQQIPIL